MKNITCEVVKKILSYRYESLSDDCIKKTKLTILDGIGNMIAGSQEAISEVLISYFKNIEDLGRYSIIGSPHKSNIINAAFANACFCHYLDYENTMHPPTHPISPTLSPSLSLSEYQLINGKQIILAIALGCEFQGRLRLEYPESGINGFHYPGTIGLLGGTVTAAKLLHLNRSDFCNALGIAGSRAGGLFANNGTMTKSTHSGNASRSSIESCLLTKEGWTANKDILESDGGFVKTFFKKKINYNSFLKNFGKPFRIEDPGFNFKYYPAQTPCHWAIDAAIRIKEKLNFTYTDIKLIEIITGPDNISINNPKPVDGLDGKFSIHYTVAISLIDGYLNLESFTDKRRFSKDVIYLLKKIKIIENESIKSLDFMKAWSQVNVYLKSGQKISEKCRYFKGHCKNPLSEDEIYEKFIMLSSKYLSKNKIDQLINKLENLEKLNDLKILFRIINK